MNSYKIYFAHYYNISIYIFSIYCFLIYYLRLYYGYFATWTCFLPDVNGKTLWSPRYALDAASDSTIVLTYIYNFSMRWYTTHSTRDHFDVYKCNIINWPIQDSVDAKKTVKNYLLMKTERKLLIKTVI